MNVGNIAMRITFRIYSHLRFIERMQGAILITRTVDDNRVLLYSNTDMDAINNPRFTIKIEGRPRNATFSISPRHIKT